MELLIECYREGRNQDEQLIARTIMFTVDPETGCKSINDIAEAPVIGDPAHCYNLRYLGKMALGWLGNEELTFMNANLDFGKATSNATKVQKAIAQAVQRFIETGSTQPPPPPPRQPEAAQLRWLTDDEWLMVLNMRGEV